MSRKPRVPKAKKGKRDDGWQTGKSEQTRQAILDATIQCYIKLGYARTTTALIAEEAGLSRGAMMYHFPSRDSVIRASVEHIHELRIQEYKVLMRNIDPPNKLMDRSRIQRGVKAVLKYHKLPSSVAYKEILMASRTDLDLKAVMKPLEREYEENFIEAVGALSPHWKQLDFDVMQTASDVVHFLITGMLLSHIQTHSRKRTKRLTEFLTDSLERMYNESGLIE